MPDWKEQISRQLAGLKLTPGREAEIVEELNQSRSASGAKVRMRLITLKRFA